MKKILFVIGLGLLPLWLLLLLTLIGLFAGSGLMTLLLLGEAATASIVLLPIVIVATVAHSVAKGSARRKLLIGVVSAAVCTCITAILIYNVGIVPDRREAKLDRERALQFAAESQVLAQAVGGKVRHVNMVSITDYRFARQFDFFAYHFPTNQSAYIVEATGEVIKTARVVVTRNREQRTFEIQCCSNEGMWSEPTR